MKEKLQAALDAMRKRGMKQFTAADLAEYLYPECREINVNGARFNLSAGVAGRLLRKYGGAYEASPRVWRF